MKKEKKIIKAWAVVGTYKRLKTDDPWNYRNQAMIYKTKTSAQSFCPAGFIAIPCTTSYYVPKKKI